MQPHKCLKTAKHAKSNKGKEPDDDDNTKPKHAIYNKLDKTQDFIVADGIVSFTCTFRYLGSQISYNLHDDKDIKVRIAATNASMGALKEIWSNPNLNTYSKYLLSESNTNEPPWSLQ